MKYLQNVVLLILFFNGVSDINNVKNLSFMIFFVVFTAYEKLYRKYAFILTISICIPIFAQQVFSLFYELVLNDEKKMK
jgi:hypothetical protein